MKGVVFTEFLEMVDGDFGLDVTETILDKADLPSGGAYSNVGTYEHSEIVALIVELSTVSGVEVPVLVKAFGEYMLRRFSVLYPAFFDDVPDVLSFLENVDGYIHGEVRKLYPDATLPTIATARLADGEFELVYKSSRRLADFAEGLIGASLKHFSADYSLTRFDLPDEGDRQCARFVLARLQ